MMLKSLEPYSDIIKNGGVVSFPTETVYGLGASASNSNAIQHVFNLKGRPADNPLIVHVCTWNQLLHFAMEVPATSRIIMQKFWPGPITFIFKKKSTVLDIITCGLDTVAVRMPDNLIALKLIAMTGPLVAPSANKSGRPSPTKAQHVKEDFGSDIAIIDGGETRIGLESTVLDVSVTPFRILRPGYVTAAMIKSKCNVDVQDGMYSIHQHAPVRSPGMKYSHYAPKANVRWMQKNDIPYEGVLVLRHSEVTRISAPDEVQFDGDIDRMARELYDSFRQADLNKYTEIWIESLEGVQHSLVDALTNRINRAIRSSQ